ncbi:hypothetical protein C1H46_038127 [Malus baccata]|uniref:Uncharacterized protein n=1 Tax=Malus baccata TaxID=106549 RepID=A0A540KQ85_MALBA|nr:hypothetical protein C1H46_038127 [Malus baccata]
MVVSFASASTQTERSSLSATQAATAKPISSETRRTRLVSSIWTVCGGSGIRSENTSYTPATRLVCFLMQLLTIHNEEFVEIMGEGDVHSFLDRKILDFYDAEEDKYLANLFQWQPVPIGADT